MVFTFKKPFSLHRAIKGLLDEVSCVLDLRLNIQKGGYKMTSNQINYWSLQERIRNDKATETETNRANRARETETNRANLAQERELNRSHRAQEAQAWYNYLLAKRQQNETERQNRFHRDNQTKLTDEQKRSNLANEAIKRVSALADFNRSSEQARHNAVLESQNQRQIAETRRVNDSTLLREDRRLKETVRYNLAEQELKAGTLTETQRSNLADENIRRFQNNLTSQRLVEEIRHNMTNERVQQQRNRIEVFKTTLHEASQLVQSLANVSLRSIPRINGGAL